MVEAPNAYAAAAIKFLLLSIKATTDSDCIVVLYSKWNQINRPSEFLALKQESRILGYSSNPVRDSQVRLCAVLPMENWPGSSLNQMQGWTTVQESYSQVLEQGSLLSVRPSRRKPLFTAR